ncbi:MAG TPA: hypothetical protein VD837_09425 [Terriglobales bacterium]|nr:hypothetical protein [Terriglobales bacterium]
MRHHKFCFAAGVLVFAALMLSAPRVLAQRGALVAPSDVAQLAAQARTILRGRVISAHVEPHPELSNLSTVVVTIKVDETLKGTPGATYTFRQYIWDIRDRMDGAGYRKGQEYLLLMNAPTKRGLTSPAGLEQGRFRILRDGEGRETAVNGYDNFGLFRNLETTAQKRGVQLSTNVRSLAKTHKSGAVLLDDLRTVIKQFAGAK